MDGEIKTMVMLIKRKKARVPILISKTANFKTRNIIRDKERHDLVIKRSIIQEDITIFKVYVSTIRVSNSMRQKLIELQGEIDASTITVGDFKNPSIRNRQK